MKHITALLLSACCSLAASAAEVVVYSPPSDQALHVSGGGVTRVFPASYTGHRAVCDVPGASTNDTFCAWIGGDAYAPGDPFGVSSLYDYPTIGLTRTSAVTPRFDLWQTNVTDRKVVCGVSPTPRDDIMVTNAAPARYDWTRVRVFRYKVDNYPILQLGVPAAVMLDRVFQKDARSYLHEGDFTADGEFDLDWASLKDEVVDWRGARYAMVTNMQYLVVLDDTEIDYQFNNTNTVSHPFIIERRFEKTRTAPTAVSPQGTIRTTRPKFSWKIVGEDPWAAEFGTTYTAFKLRIWSGTSTNSSPIVSTDYLRMPPQRTDRTFSYTLDEDLNDGSTYTWQVLTYNSKWKEDYVDSYPLGTFYGGSAPLTFTTDLTE